MIRSRRRLAAGLGAVGLWAAVLGGCGARTESEDAAMTPRAVVRVGTIARQSFEDAVTAPGQWRSAGDVVIAAPFTASVESLAPRAGDFVEEGQRIGSLITHESRATLRGAELLVQQASDAQERAAAERALALARHEIVRVPLQAPRSGIVTHRAAEEGSELSDGAEILTLTPRAAIVCEVRVPADVAGRVRPGQRATISEAGVPARMATVQRVLPAAGAGDQTTLVWLAPSGPGATPGLDRFATATIELGPPRTATSVPVAAIVQDDLTGTARVAVVAADSTVRWTDVVLGAQAQGVRELKRPPLAPGTRVVVEGQRGLPDGTPVKAEP